jgi:hypothetical protein
MKKWVSVGIIISGLCLLLSHLSIAAEVSGARIIDYGLYVAEDVKTEKTDYGTSAVSKVEKLIKQTDRVPARIGTTFGLRYRLEGKPKDGLVKLVVKVIIPSPGLTNPKTGKTFNSLSFTKVKVKIDKIHHELLTFEEKWDLVLGNWKIQILYEGKMVAEKTFAVYKP